MDTTSVSLTRVQSPRSRKPSEPEARLVERAYAEVRAALLRSEFDPGSRLRLEVLSQRFGVSANPLRAALNRLVEQGLVRAEGHRGFQVAPLTCEGMADLTHARLLIECDVLRDAMTHGDDRWESGMVAAGHSLRLAEKRLADQAPMLDEAWCQRHREFHLSLYAGARSPLLLGIAIGLFDSAERYRQYAARRRTPRRATADEHPVLLDAVLTRDHERAQALLRQHIASTETRVQSCLSALQNSPPD